MVDGIINEPPGGAHRDFDGAADLLGDAVEAALAELQDVSPEELVERRLQKFLAMGRTLDPGLPA